MDYRALVAAVLEENRQVLDAVNPQEIEGFIEEILRAETLHLYGRWLRCWNKPSSCSRISS